jgi:serine/threonine protein kinase
MALFNGEPIHTWWNRVQLGKQLLGTGRSSEAFLVNDNETLYIVRLTDVTNYMTKRTIRHEIEIYQQLMTNPNYKIYISTLLFAYCPPDRSIENQAFFVFQYSMGMPLDTLISFFNRKRLRIKKSTRDLWYHQMQETMEFLKTVQVVHRDIKPANLFMDSETNRLLLFDFDMACFVGDDCKTTDFRGTQVYAKENALRLRLPGFHLPYQYSHSDDYHAIEVMFDRDISTIVEGQAIQAPPT